MLFIRYLILISFFLTSCAHQSRRSQIEALKQAVKSGDLEKAEKIIHDKDFYQEKESKLIKLVDLGNINYLKGNYIKSLDHFNKANELSQKLFTVSVSRKIKAYLVSRTKDNYYGEKFERSYIFLMQVLNHFQLYLKDPVKNRNHLLSARASVLSWDSLLSTYRSETAGETIFKDDILAKLIGAQIHLTMNTRSERNIAKQLFKDAKKLIFQNYNAYPSFNKKYKLFNSNFSKLHKMKKKEVQKKFVESTFWSDQLISYIDSQLEKIKDNRKDNVLIFISQDFIAEKYAKKSQVDFPLHILPGTIPLSQKNDFLSYVRTNMVLSSGTSPILNFEMPNVKAQKPPLEMTLEINKNEVALLQTSLNLTSPYSEMSKQAHDYRLPAIRSALVTRLATKHLTALASSYMAGRTLRKTVRKKDGGEGLAVLGSTLGYIVGKQLIKDSEKADLRQCLLIPGNFLMSSLSLEPGDYTIKIKNGDKILIDHNISIKDKGPHFLHKHLFLQ